MSIKSTTFYYVLRAYFILFVIKIFGIIQVSSNDRLKVIAYATDPAPSKYLQEFSSRYNLDFELIGVGDKWTGFNSKVRGFYNFLKKKKNEFNDNDIILMLDAYDTIIICDEEYFLNKFKSYSSDIVMSTGKECWPDPNLQKYLLDRMDPSFKSKHPYFPYFLCINSGAMMGKFSAMYSMIKRVNQLVINGNGSCNDFQGNSFSTNTQSDQRCYTTYYVEWMNNKKSNYPDITIKLDHNHSLFNTMGGMLTYNYDIKIDANNNNNQNITVTNKFTGHSGCVLHGNGPGVIIWRSVIKQILNNGTLYFNDYLTRLNYDFFVGWMDFFTIPYQRLSHYLSKKYKFDLGMHSTNFSEEFAAKFNIGFLTTIIIFISYCYIKWYPKSK